MFHHDQRNLSFARRILRLFAGVTLIGTHHSISNIPPVSSWAL